MTLFNRNIFNHTESDDSDLDDFEVVETTGRLFSGGGRTAVSASPVPHSAPAPAPPRALFGSSSSAAASAIGSATAALSRGGGNISDSFGSSTWPQQSVSFGSARSAAAPPPAAPISARVQSQQVQQQQFKPVDLTKEMAETYYWGRQDQAVVLTGHQDANAFWLEYVEWDEAKGGSFLSQVQLFAPLANSNEPLFADVFLLTSPFLFVFSLIELCCKHFELHERDGDLVLAGCELQTHGRIVQEIC